MGGLGRDLSGILEIESGSIGDLRSIISTWARADDAKAARAKAAVVKRIVVVVGCLKQKRMYRC